MKKKEIETREQTVEQTHLKTLKTIHRWHVAFAVLISMVSGVILGYFASINVITDSQNKAVEVVRSLK